jgi:hypothetical protein
MKTNLIGISGKIGSGKDTVGSILQYLSWQKALNNSVGNSTVYEEYCKLRPGGYTGVWQIKKYADKLKDMVCLLIGCTRDQLEDREFKDKPLGKEWDDSHGINTPRELLQILGTDCGRDIIHPNIWVNALFADYNSKQEFIKHTSDGFEEWSGDLYPNWIITDVRFPNEAQAIKDRGGIVIRVNRDSELEYKHTDKDALEMLTGMGYEDIDDDFSEEAINEGFRWSETLQKWSFDEDNFQEHPSETALDDYEFDHVIENDGSIEELVEKVKQLNLV